MKHFLIIILVALMAVGAKAQSASRIYIEDFEITPDSTIIVPVIMANVENTRGFQYYITLPEGLELEDQQLTDYSNQYKMTLSCRYSTTSSCYMIFVYPMTSILFPPDTMEVMTLEFYASPDFKGGLMPVWKCRGATADNTAIIYQGDTTMVSVPSASLIGIPMDQQPVKDQFFNLMGQPIDSPECAPVAIEVMTVPNGQRSSRKVAVTH